MKNAGRYTAASSPATRPSTMITDISAATGHAQRRSNRARRTAIGRRSVKISSQRSDHRVFTSV